MFVLKVENNNGHIIRLTQNEEEYQVIGIDGLNPPVAQINTSAIAGVDGASFNSSKLQTRNVVITIKINGDIEKNRIRLYKYFRNKQYCKIYYQNETRNVYIEGYVEALEVSQFTNDERAQISIICPNPYFKDMETIIQSISKIVKKFIFPFSINGDEPIPISSLELEKVTNIINDSESETGLIINAKFIGRVSKLEIRNVDNGQSFVINYEFIKDDKLIVNCNKGSKSIILTREAVEYNLIPYMQKGSSFFQLGIGDNHFSFLADEGINDMLVDINFKYYKVYSGV